MLPKRASLVGQGKDNSHCVSSLIGQVPIKSKRHSTPLPPQWLRQNRRSSGARSWADAESWGPCGALQAQSALHEGCAAASEEP